MPWVLLQFKKTSYSAHPCTFSAQFCTSLVLVLQYESLKKLHILIHFEHPLLWSVVKLNRRQTDCWLYSAKWKAIRIFHQISLECGSSQGCQAEPPPFVLLLSAPYTVRTSILTNACTLLTNALNSKPFTNLYQNFCQRAPLWWLASLRTTSKFHSLTWLSALCIYHF